MNALAASPDFPGMGVSTGRVLDAWVRQWRAPMLRFAKLHLSSQDDAEDAVQEAFAAILSTSDSLSSVRDPRNYLFGILRNKIMDRLRQRYRHNTHTSAPDTDELDPLLFDVNQHWLSGVAPRSWSSPEDALENSHFFKVVDICLDNLPEKPARVFSMKELLECEPEEICSTLAISKADYWQCMSRARKQIHLCLNQNWFGGGVL